MARTEFIKKLTFGVFGNIADFLLWYTYFSAASVGKTGSRGVYQAAYEADKELAHVNHRSIVTAFRSLLKQNLIIYRKREQSIYPEITAIGRKKLQQRIPLYLSNRPWDKKIYLITYDIPEQAHNKRDRFRAFLQRLDCVLFQESIWLTPYNPKPILDDFVRQNDLLGMIIISDIGPDGGIGELTLTDLLTQLYKLDELNKRYKNFIVNVNKKTKAINYLFFEYLSTLKDDPQLPFQLLPSWWLGDKAFHIYKKELQKHILARGRDE